jgi:hypothetical protein
MCWFAYVFDAFAISVFKAMFPNKGSETKIFETSADQFTTHHQTSPNITNKRSVFCIILYGSGAPTRWVTVVPSAWIKLPGHEADQSLATCKRV